MEMEEICDENKKYEEEEEEEEIVDLQGFRFNPTDEELVGFYLLRKVEGKSMSIELIKQVDIYKYDPWDLPKMGSRGSVGDKEWYYFCMRGRKYRNSLRPNRVTVKGSGFWKATGIDKPIYSSNYMKCYCIGLKKSLVYYCGSAGKGTKTDWMMHEFRLPQNHSNNNSIIIQDSAQVWTLCRIFKRKSSYQKCTPNCKQTINSKTSLKESNSTTCSLESAESSGKYITFFQDKDLENNLQERSHYDVAQEISITQSLFTSSSSTSLWNPNGDEFFRNGNWDELGSVVELALDRSL